MKLCLGRRFGGPFAAAVLVLAIPETGLAQSGEIGVDSLIARLGATAPTGAGVVVGQVEAGESPGNYGPNQTNGEFVGKTFIAQSGPPGASGHATLVGQNMYGSVSGMAPGITTIHLYDANSWAQTGFLRVNQGAANLPLPIPTGLKMFNNSWVGSFGSAGLDNEALRRADFVVNRDQILMINGVNNAPNPQQPLLCMMFNGISVGLTGSQGSHTSGPTPATIDGPGRTKPEIVAPSQFTSFACPYVDAVAARIVETARTYGNLPTNTNSERVETLKSILLAGGNHASVAWSNNPATSGPTRGITTTPLDPVFGAGVVNVDNSHLIMTGLEQNGSSSIPTSVNITRRGWDYVGILTNASRYYRFRISAVAPSVTVLMTWNRQVETNLVAWSLADFTLTLHRVDSRGQLTSLVGDAGLPYFSGGNVVSQSLVDNVEHLYIQNLQPGEYVIQAQRVDALGGNRTMCISWLLPRKTGDVNEDGSVNIIDLLAVISSYGACPPPCLPACPADINGDCNVNVVDLLAVITNWG